MPTPPESAPSPGSTPTEGSREIFHDAVRYWELRRAGYNVALAALTIGWVVVTWPHFRPAFNVVDGLRLLVLALLANVAYCAAYLVDLPLQHSSFRDVWRRRRWALWTAGTLFALLFTHYWIGDEIYPYVS